MPLFKSYCRLVATFPSINIIGNFLDVLKVETKGATESSSDLFSILLYFGVDLVN